jgi:hypothetical protein
MKIHAILCGDTYFLFLEGTQAHVRDPNIQKWVTLSLLLLHASNGVGP